LSNVVPVTASVISNTQVTNLQNNQYIPDVIITVGSPANTSSTPKFFIFNSALYFIGTNDPSAASSKLYKCTTSNVVTQASNINTNGPDFTYDWNPILFNSQMYFTSNDTTGTFNQIQRMDTSGNINSVTSSNINVAAGGYDENSLFIFNSKLYFIGSERTNTLTTGGNKLWAIDTSNNVTLVTNLNAGANDFNTGIGMPFQPIIFNTAMYFPALNGSYYNLYSLTTSGTLTQVANTTNNPTNNWGMWNTSTAGTTPLWSPVILGSNLYFIANNAVGNGIYKIFACSTSNVVTQVSNTTNSNYGSDFYQTNAYTLDIFGEKPLLVAFNSAIYFAANNSNDMSKLYKLTNTTTITQISNLTGSQSVTDAIYSGMFVFNSQLFFVGSPFVRGNGTPVVKTYSLSTSDVISLAFNSADAIDGPAIFSSFGSPSATGGGLLPWIGIANGSTNFYVVAPCAEVPADGTTLSPNGSHNPNPLPLSLSTQFLGCALYSYSSSGVLTRVSATTHPGGGTYTPEVFPWQVHYINNAPCVYFNSTLYFWGYNQYGALKLFRL
jgi:hypothetical protein